VHKVYCDNKQLVQLVSLVALFNNFDCFNNTLEIGVMLISWPSKQKDLTGL